MKKKSTNKGFLKTNTFKDKDGRITIKQLTLAMEELFGIPHDSEESTDAAHDFQSLLWSVKIDMESFLEIIEKCRLRRLLRQANYGVEESMNKLFEMMDKVCKYNDYSFSGWEQFLQSFAKLDPKSNSLIAKP